MSIYNDSFYAKQCNGSSRSAKAILPVLFKEIGTPSSVLDIGCGVGTWAAAAMDCGVKTVIGIDGSYVPKDRLHIPKELFFDCDLNSKIKVFEKKFELSICLEVAEHLPEARADKFIEEILLCSEAVLFSAAIPKQGGTSHVNEQWQHYWVKKFNKKGFFIEFDLRPYIWDNADVEFWYSQNIFYFSQKLTSNCTKMLDVIHPKMYECQINRYENASLTNRVKRAFLKMFNYTIKRLTKGILWICSQKKS